MLHLRYTVKTDLNKRIDRVESLLEAIRQQTESSPRGSDRSAPLDVGGRSWRERPGNHFEARESITFLTQAKSRNCALSVLDEGTRRVWVPLSIRHGFDATPK